MPARRNSLLQWLPKLWGDGRRLDLRGVAGHDPAAAPLELTQVRHDDFSLALPGAWRERRFAGGMELLRHDGLERLTVSVKKLVAPLADGVLPALVERLLDDQGRQMSNDVAEPLHWREADFSPLGKRLEGRRWGSDGAGRLHVALLARAGERRILLASIVCRNPAGNSDQDPSADAFAGRSAVIFDRLSE